MNTQERKDDLITLLRDKEYRDAFVEASINIGVPSQIKVLRKQREWSQETLGDKAKMAQPSIHRIEDPTCGSVNNIKTLLRLASAFNVGLMVRFVPFSEMVDWKLKLSLKSMEVESFDKEKYFKQQSDEEIAKAKKILEAPAQPQQLLPFRPYVVWNNKQKQDNTQKQNIKYNPEEICKNQKDIMSAEVMV